MSDPNLPGDLSHVPGGVAAAIAAHSEGIAASDTSPFFHGTSRLLAPGAHLTAGHPSNYRPDILMNHVHFTALKDGTGASQRRSRSC